MIDTDERLFRGTDARAKGRDGGKEGGQKGQQNSTQGHWVDPESQIFDPTWNPDREKFGLILSGRDSAYPSVADVVDSSFVSADDISSTAGVSNDLGA